MSKLCHLCQSLDFAAISFQNISGASMTELQSSNHDQYEIYFDKSDAAAYQTGFEAQLTRYHNSLQSLIEAADGVTDQQEKCHFCKLVLPSVAEVLESLERSKGRGWTTSGQAGSWSFFVTGRLIAGSGVNIIGLNRHANAEKPEKRHVYMLVAALEFRVEYGSALSPVIRSFKTNHASRNSILIDSANIWIQHCKRSHKHPAASAGGDHTNARSLPTRVLTVSDDGQSVYLQTEYTEKCGSYLALSYSWGKVASLKLTVSTRDKLAKGMSLAGLPYTFQDAIWVTCSLGYRNIWIDSLCIQQDDRQDWQRESIKMHHIYQNAVVTIAATRAADSSAGFLGSRIEPDHAVLPYRSLEGRHAGDQGKLFRNSNNLPKSQPENLRGVEEVVIAYHSPLRYEYRERYEATFHDEPLSARAWTLQERMLSTRTLHFTSQGLYLECDSDFISERSIPLLSYEAKPPEQHSTTQTGYATETALSPLRWIDLTLAPWTKSHTEVSKLHKRIRINFNVGAVPLSSLFKVYWRHVVSDFSRRKLTFPSDKLPAIAGIASHFANIQDDTLERQRRRRPGSNDQTTRVCYYAGIFFPENGSIEPLQWQIDRRFYQRLACRSDNSPVDDSSPRRPSTYRAPTWSWASLDGAVEWVAVQKIKAELALVKGVHVQHASADSPYGEVTSAWLRLEAILFPLLYESEAGQKSWFINAPGKTDTTLVVSPTWDISTSYNYAHGAEKQHDSSYSIEGQSSLQVAILGMGGPRDRVFLKALILAPLAGTDGDVPGFTRRGTAFIRADNQSSENSRELYNALKTMFDSREGMAEVLLY